MRQRVQAWSTTRTGRAGIAAGGVVGLALVWLARWRTSPLHASSDTYWYYAQALRLTGMSRHAAMLRAGGWWCRLFDPRLDPTTCAPMWLRISPRYRHIFFTRIGFPSVIAPFVPLVGHHAIFLATLVLGVGFGVAFTIAVRLFGA
ncbi:MAG: hypothetical protein ACYCYA_09135, partial [Actinomycetes bacterium]